MKTKLLSLFVALVTTPLWAYDYYIDGIYYKVDSSNLIAEVISNGPGSYSGNVVIPAEFMPPYTSPKSSFSTSGNCAPSSSYGSVLYKVTAIGENAFSNCPNLTSIEIPNSVTTIRENAFSNCPNLTEVRIKSESILNKKYTPDNNLKNIFGNQVKQYYLGRSIGDYAFSGCTGLTSVSGDFRTIGNHAFSGCTSLTSINLAKLTTIGDYAFFGCTSLTQSISISNTFIYLPASYKGSYSIPYRIHYIAKGAFSDCSGLTSINVDNNNNYYASIEGVLFNYAKDTIIQYPQDYSQTEYVIPNSVTTIGNDAFYACSNMTSVTIPASVTTIEKKAFFGCSKLTSIRSYATVPPACEESCFENVDVSIPVYVPARSLAAYKQADKWSQFYNLQGFPDDYATITCIAENGTISGAGKYIKEDECILTVTPNLGYSFVGWTDGNTDNPRSFIVTQDSTFIAKIIVLHKGQCGNNLKWYYANGTMTITGSGAMYNYSFEEVPWYLFRDSIQQIILNEGLTHIGNSAFAFCTKISSITIPNSVVSIGESAFENSTFLKALTFGKELRDIGCNAFKGDYRIMDITIYAETTPNVCTSTFEGLNTPLVYLFVPENCIRDYQIDLNWNKFDIRTKSADVKPIDDENPIVTPTDQDVTITWPITEGTDTYTLTITKGGETVCVLTFNANGQLINIAFAAPGHNGAHQAPAATLTAQGFQFTVTGLNPGTAYDYSVTATDAVGQTLAEHKGNFSTTGGGTPTSMDDVHDSQCTMHKYFHNGNLIIERNGVKYTPTGQKVR